jgi:WD40 repeat protein
VDRPGFRSATSAGKMAIIPSQKDATVGPAGDPLLAELASLVGPEAAPPEGASAAGDARAEHPGLPARYELRRLVGCGGMGQVYEAYDRLLGRRVAVKILSKKGPVSIGLMRREREVLAALEHPGVVAIYDSGELADGAPYYVMRYVEGENLSAYVRGGRLSARKTVALVLRVARAVGVAHLVRIVHRDLKPQNILVTAGGEPVVLDFGLAKFTGAADEAGDCGEAEEGFHTLARGKVRGTPAYMSPEQAAGEAVDARSDVYSLAVILRELLTGEPPGSRPARRIRPRRLAAIVRKGLNADADQRYQSANELADDLEAYLSDHPIHAVGSGRSLHAGAQFVRRNKRRLGVAACAVLFCVATALVAFDRVRRERDVALTNELRAKRERDAAEQNRRWAMEEKTRADEREAEARRHLYAGELVRASQALDARDFAAAREILDRFSPAAHPLDERTFEWRWLDRLCREGPIVVAAGSSPIASLALSPRGTLLAAGDREGCVRVWRLVDGVGAPPRALKHEGRHIVSLAFSSDERTLVSVDRWATAMVWNAEEGSRRCAARHMALSRASATAVSPDGGMFAAGTRNGGVAVFRADSGALVSKSDRVAANEILSLDVSPDGARLAVGSKDNRARVLQLPSLAILAEFPPLPTPVRAVRFREGSNERLLAHLMHGGVYECEVSSASTRAIGDLSIGIAAASRSPADGDVATTVHENGEICRRLRDGVVRRSRILAEKAAATAVSADGTWVAASAERSSRIVLDQPQSVRGCRAWTLQGAPGRLALDAGGGRVVAAASAECNVFNADTHERLARLRPSGSDVAAVAVDPARRLLAAADVDGRVVIADLDTGEVQATFQTDLTHATSLACDAEEGRIAVGGAFGGLECWDAAGRRRIWKQAAHRYFVSDVRFTSDARMIVTASWDGSVKLCDAATGEVHRTIGGQLGVLDRVALDPLGAWVAAACRDGRLRRWNLADGETASVIEQDGMPASALAASPDGRSLAAVFSNGAVARLVFQHIPTNRKTLVLDLPFTGASDLGFSADGGQLFAVARGANGEAVLASWDARTGAGAASTPVGFGDR